MKTEFVYLALIVVSILALLGILRIGKGLVAPPHVSGVWQVAADTASGTDPCHPQGPGNRYGELEIVQSGTVMELAFRGDRPVRAAARLRRDTLFTTPIEPVAPCTVAWSLRAQFERKDAPNRMSGHWVATECEACDPRPFAAMRIESPEREEG